jgi:hypothetical protein
MEDSKYEEHPTFPESPALDSAYRAHSIFAELSGYAEFYKAMSFSLGQFPASGTSAIFLDSCIISSIQATIESIKLILDDGKINDSYALVRKYYDSVVIHVYEVLYLENNFSVENLVVQKIESWVQGKEKLPRYGDMVKYIANCVQLKDINKLLELDTRYRSIRERCNDHTHYNLFSYMRLNDNQAYIQNRLEFLDSLAHDIRDIFILHFMWLFTSKEYYMMSSDYVDSLDCGITPNEGTQYYVAPFIQDFFNDVTKKYRPDLAEELKNTTSMRLE